MVDVTAELASCVVVVVVSTPVAVNALANGAAPLISDDGESGSMGEPDDGLMPLVPTDAEAPLPLSDDDTYGERKLVACEGDEDDAGGPPKAH